MAKKKETTMMSVDVLKEHPQNPRFITDVSLANLQKSLLEDPELFNARPIIVSNRTGENIVIAGNQRLKASTLSGVKEVPVYIIEGMTEEDEFRVMMKDNADNFGQWDWAILENSNKIGLLKDNMEWGISLPEKYFEIQKEVKEKSDKKAPLQSYTIFFQDQVEMEQFYKFLGLLRSRFSGVDNVGQRVLLWIADLLEENKQFEDSELIMKMIGVELDLQKKEIQENVDYGEHKGKL